LFVILPPALVVSNGEAVIVLFARRYRAWAPGIAAGCRQSAALFNSCAASWKMSTQPAQSGIRTQRCVTCTRRGGRVHRSWKGLR